MLHEPRSGGLWGPWVGLPALGIALTTLSVVSIGTPGTLLLLGGWSLAAALGRLLPSMDGPVSWAGGVVVEVGLVSLLSAVLASLSGREHGRWPNLLVLAVPPVIGAGGLLAARLRGQGRSPRAVEPRRSRPLVAAVVSATGLVVPLWIASHGVNYRIAWAMSGDARNHVLIVRQILSAGGLTTSQLRDYPAVLDSVTALISGAGHRRGLLPGQLMLHDMDAVVVTYVLAGTAIALMTVAALLELLPRALSAARRLPVAVLVLVLAAASTSASALVLGTSLQDGYLSAYGTLPLVLASLVLTLRSCAVWSPLPSLLLGPAAVLVFFSWTLLAAIPLALILVASAAYLLRWRRGTDENPDAAPAFWSVAVPAAVALGSGLVLVGVTVTHVSLLHTQFVSSGAITMPQPRILYLLAFLAFALLATASGVDHRWQLLAVVTAAVVGGATVKFLLWLGPDGKSWTYYAAKSLYLVSASLVWLAFVPALLALVGRDGVADYGPLGTGRRTLLAAASSLTVLVLLGWTTTLTNPLQRAAKGWDQPSAGVITEVARVADKGQPFILWNWTDPGNERLGDFWASLTWGYTDTFVARPYPPALPNGIPYWAYFEGDTPKDLCTAATGVAGLDIVTHDPKVRTTLDRLCPNIGAHVLLEPAG